MGIREKISQFCRLEELARNTSVIHRRNPLVKLFAALFYIVTLASFESHALLRIIPFVFYPAVLIPLSGTPFSVLLRRFAAVLPFCLCFGLSNLLTDDRGVISFAVIILRAFLCVTAALLFMSVTTVSDLTNSLLRVRVPWLFTSLFEMTYRFAGLLPDEAAAMYTAYKLRCAKLTAKVGSGVALRHYGAFAGSLLLRSIDRGNRVWQAALCRGYTKHAARTPLRFGAADIVFGFCICAACLFLRLVNIYA